MTQLFKKDLLPQLNFSKNENVNSPLSDNILRCDLRAKRLGEKERSVRDLQIISFEKSKTLYLEIVIVFDYKTIIAYPVQSAQATRLDSVEVHMQ